MKRLVEKEDNFVTTLEEEQLPAEVEETQEKVGILKRVGSFAKKHWKAGLAAGLTFVGGCILGYSKGKAASDDYDEDYDDYDESDDESEVVDSEE